MGLGRLSQALQQLHDLLQALPPRTEDAQRVVAACNAAQLAVAELPGRLHDPLSPADCEQLSRCEQSGIAVCDRHLNCTAAAAGRRAQNWCTGQPSLQCSEPQAWLAHMKAAAECAT